VNIYIIPNEVITLKYIFKDTLKHMINAEMISWFSRLNARFYLPLSMAREFRALPRIKRALENHEVIKYASVVVSN